MAQKEYLDKTNTTKEKTRKTDRRTIYTRKLIMDCYIQLLKEKSREKIRITELCKLAEINRCTFYLHFNNIWEVGDAIEQELFQKFKKFVQTQKTSSPQKQSLSDTFFEKMLHDDTYVTLMSMQQFESPLADFMRDYYLEEMNDSLPPDNNLTAREKELLYDFIAGGVSAVQRNWIQSDTTNLKEENLLLDKIVRAVMSVKKTDRS